MSATEFNLLLSNTFPFACQAERQSDRQQYCSFAALPKGGCSCSSCHPHAVVVKTLLIGTSVARVMHIVKSYWLIAKATLGISGSDSILGRSWSGTVCSCVMIYRASLCTALCDCADMTDRQHALLRLIAQTDRQYKTSHTMQDRHCSTPCITAGLR